MNLGQIDPENASFLDDYKKYGYSTKTQMANDALRILRLLKLQAGRAQWRSEAFAELALSRSQYAWENLDGDDFDQGG